MGLNGPKKNEWTEQDRSGHNGPNESKIDRIGLKWIDWTDVD